MRFRSTPSGVIVHAGARWVSLASAIAADRREAGPQEDGNAIPTDSLLGVLRGGEETRERIEQLLDRVAGNDSVAADPADAGLPFVPRSMRAFMLWEAHVVASSRMLVKHFYPPPAWRVVSGFERLTGRTFPRLRPNARFWEAPTFYVAGHTMMLADGDEMWVPAHTQALDFELELACVIARPLVDPTPEEALEAVGGWFVLNDWSARDVQADDARRNIFGPVVKSKTFANSIGCDVVTPDELGDWTRVSGRVRVDGEVWCEGTTAGPAHSLGEMIAYAARGERLDAGDVVSTGTMPGCCGLELERWIRPGQTVELEIDGVGTVANRLSATARPTTAVPA